MARRKKGRAVSGWLNLDKAAGNTSTAAVASVKRLFAAAKVGHAGTLDPLATGALPIALGEATKTVAFVQDARKLYRFTIRWGTATDTDDCEGSVIAVSEARPDPAAIAAALPAFTGTIAQRPPAFSAIKVAGNRAYDLARAGEEVVLAERAVVIDRLALVAVPDDDHAVFEVECGKGAYVRALARDLGRALGSFAHVVALRRRVVGPFDEAAMVTLADLIDAREAGGVEALDRFLRPIGFALADLPEIVFSAGEAARIRRGQPVLVRGTRPPAAGIAHATCAGRTIAVGEIGQGAFHPTRVFQA